MLNTVPFSSCNRIFASARDKEIAVTTLFVGNLAPEVSDSDLRAVFEAYGRITSIRLMSRRGLAYVELDPEGAKAALDGLRGQQLKGRTVDIALDTSSGNRPGRRRGKRR